MKERTVEEAQTLVILMLLIRSVLDITVEKEGAVAGEGKLGDDFGMLIKKAPLIEQAATEYCLAVIRQDKSGSVLAEVDKILNHIHNVISKMLNQAEGD